MENYHIIELVGEGSFGKVGCWRRVPDSHLIIYSTCRLLQGSLNVPKFQVYKGRRKYTGQIVALKFIAKFGKSDKDIKSLRQEIEILRGLRHENIILMLDTFETKTDFCVVTEFGHGAPAPGFSI